MSRTKDQEKRWKELERELEKAVAEDKMMTKRQRREYQGWLGSLPEHVPLGTGNMVRVIFFGTDKSSEPEKNKKDDDPIRERTRNHIRTPKR